MFFVSVLSAFVSISANGQGMKTQDVVGSSPTTSTPGPRTQPSITGPALTPAPPPAIKETYQPAQPLIMKSPSREDKIPDELMAILKAAFGANGRTNENSNCFGNREIACPSDTYNESYSNDSFANARPTSASELKTPFKILGTFKKYFDGCTEKAGLGNCKFVNLGVKGDASHQRRRSCHNSAQAIDVGPLTCSTGRRVLASDPKYFAVASCMANQTNNELQVIFYKSEGPNMMRKSDHNNHMHIQLKNCAMTFG